jgi:threonine/homoserine/homoserine lactone efflux protein
MLATPALSYEAQRRRFTRMAIAPSLLLLLLVAGLPTAFLLVTSLTPGSLINPGSLTDFREPLANYQNLVTDKRFHETLWVQARLSLYTVVLQVLLGTGMALLVHSGQDRWQSLRHLFVIPMVLPPIVVAVIWKLIYTPDISPIFHTAKALGFMLPAFTSHADFALAAIVGVNALGPALFDALGVVCGLYLIWLGGKAMFARGEAAPMAVGSLRPVRAGLAFGLTNPKAYPVSVAVFTALTVRYASGITFASAPALMGAAVVGFLAGYVVILYWAGLPVVRRFFLRHGRAVTRVVGVTFVLFGAKSLADAGRSIASRA